LAGRGHTRTPLDPGDLTFCSNYTREGVAGASAPAGIPVACCCGNNPFKVHPGPAHTALFVRAGAVSRIVLLTALPMNHRACTTSPFLSQHRCGDTRSGLKAGTPETSEGTIAVLNRLFRAPNILHTPPRALSASPNFLQARGLSLLAPRFPCLNKALNAEEAGLLSRTASYWPAKIGVKIQYAGFLYNLYVWLYKITE
jgi:hypothetical protein